MVFQIFYPIAWQLKRIVISVSRQLSRLNSVIILTLLFLLVVVPTGFMFRLLRRSIFRKSTTDSNWMIHSSSLDLGKPF